MILKQSLSSRSLQDAHFSALLSEGSYSNSALSGIPQLSYLAQNEFDFLHVPDSNSRTYYINIYVSSNKNYQLLQ